jgi:hypothetical protein
MITHDARRSLSHGNNPVPSPWLATLDIIVQVWVRSLVSTETNNQEVIHD